MNERHEHQNIGSGGRLALVRWIIVALLMSTAIVVPLRPATADPVRAADSPCLSSGPAGGTYTVNVCLTAPTAGATVSGNRTVTATATRSGTSLPSIGGLNFYLNGAYILSDHKSAPYQFALPTARWVDGVYTLEVEAEMGDGFVSSRAHITLTFANGVTQPPVNTNSFTPATPGGQGLVVAAVGDGADSGSAQQSVVNQIATWNPNLLLYLGDVYDEGTATEFHNWYQPTWGQFRSITNPTIGNHEYPVGNGAGYFNYWDNIPHYYSYNAGGWHFVSLNSVSEFNQYSSGTAQMNWLVQDLQQSANPCTIVYFHSPVIRRSGGVNSRLTYLWSVLNTYGVDLAMVGDNHTYERWQPLNSNFTPDASGVTEFIVGTGGHGFNTSSITDPRLASSIDSTFGALRLTLNADNAGFAFVSTTGSVLDSGSIPCADDPTPTATPTPTRTPSPTRTATATGTPTNTATATGTATQTPTTTNSPTVTNTPTITNTATPSNTPTVTNTPTATQTPGPPGSDVFTDGFESGDLSQWPVSTGLTVQQAIVANGQYAAQGINSSAWARAPLASAQAEVTARLNFQVVSKGNNELHFLRLQDGGNTRLIDVYLSPSGRLSFRRIGTTASTQSTAIPSFGAWHELKVRFKVNGTAGEIEIWLDGVRIDALSVTANLGSALVAHVEIGEVSSSRTFNVVFDDVQVTLPPGIDPPTATPTNTAIPTATDTDTATPVPTDTGTPIPTDTATPVPTDTGTPIPTDTATSTDTASPVPTDTGTPIPTDTATATDTATQVATDTATETVVPSSTDTDTPVPTGTGTSTETATATATATTVPVDPSIILAAGDIAECGSSGDDATGALIASEPGSVLALGDLAYDEGTAAQFTNCYNPSWGGFKDRTYPVPGNHEYNTEGATGYYNYFGARAGDPTTGYYSYDLGAWHIVALNSNCTKIGGCEAGSAQEQWLRADLAANPNSCTLAYWHHPLYSSGLHGNNPQMRDLWQALYDSGAEIVLSGHDHIYERFAPQDALGNLDTAGGIRQFVVGTGGKGLYSINIEKPNSEVKRNDTWGVLRLRLLPTGYEWTFLPVAGKTFTDSGTSSCSTPALPTPTNTATGTATETATSTPLATDTATPVPTDTATSTATPSATATETPVPTASSTATDTATPVSTATATATDTATPAPTETDTAVPTATATLIPTDTATLVPTTTAIPTDTATLLPTETSTPIPTATSTTILTETATNTATATATVPSGPLVFTPAADAHVVSGSPSSNFGSLATLIVDSSPRTDSYLRFTVAGLAGAPQSATLRLWVVDATSNGPPVASCGSSTWSETGITWANAPASTGARDDKGAIATGIWVEYDVTPFVIGNGSVCFALIPQSTNGVDFSSKEGVNPPQLVVTGPAGPAATATNTSTPGPTSTNTPIPTASATNTVGPTATMTSTATASMTASNTPIGAPSATATTPPSGALLFSDGFESGDLFQWPTVSGLVVQQEVVATGAWAARATSSGTTAAYGRANLSSSETEVYAQIRFFIVSQASNELNLMRLTSGGNTAIISIHVTPGGKLAFRRVGGIGSTSSTTSVSKGAWHVLQVRLLVNGNAGESEIWLDGVRVSSLSVTASFGAAAIARVEIGDSSRTKTFDLAIDDVEVSVAPISSSAVAGFSRIASTTVATVTATPTASPTVTATATSAVGTELPTVLPTETTVPEPTPSATSATLPTEPVDPVPTDTVEPAPTNSAAPAETPTEVAIAPTAYPVVQTSRSESTVSGAMAIDQNVATVWQTADGQEPGTHAILRLELGAHVPIGVVRLFAGSSGLMGTPTIETSLDGETWFYFADPSPSITRPDGWIDVGADPTVVGPVIARYVRIVFANTSETSSLGGLAEVEVWPPASS